MKGKKLQEMCGLLYWLQSSCGRYGIKKQEKHKILSVTLKAIKK